MSVHFTVPGRPHSWQRAVDVPGKNGKRVKITPKDMRQQQKVVATLARVQMRGQAMLTGALRLELLCVYAIPRSWSPAKQAAALDGQVWKTSVPDFDNLVKLVSDALNGVTYGDDAQIALASIGKRYGKPERTEVRISRIDGYADSDSEARFNARLAEQMGQSTLPLPSSKASHTHSTRKVR